MFFFFFFLNFKLALKTQVHPTMQACISFPRRTLPRHALSRASLPLIIHIFSVFQNRISSDPDDVQQEDCLAAPVCVYVGGGTK